MFESQTLFIVGAGASREIGLPTGAELKATIANLLDIRFKDGLRMSSGDVVIAEVLRRQGGGNLNAYLPAAWAIREAMAQAISIDNYIDAHRADAGIALCGKLAIASAILTAERNSKLASKSDDRSSPQFRSLADTWYSGFFQMLTENVAWADIDEAVAKVSFITFNYDRCIEHFLIEALQNYYRVDRAAAQQVARKFKIYHPYGMVGSLPSASKPTGVPFGSKDCDLLSIAGQLKTFTEQVSDDAAIAEMQSLITAAETLVFLGFAFHPQNLDLIAPKGLTIVNRVFATATGISDPDCRAIRDGIEQMLNKGARVELRNDLTCAALFAEYRRTLPRLSRA